MRVDLCMVGVGCLIATVTTGVLAIFGGMPPVVPVCLAVATVAALVGEGAGV